MVEEQEDRPAQSGATLGQGARYLFTAACLVIVIAGLKAAGTFLLPVLLAGILALVAIPATRRLRKWGLPNWLAIFGVVILLMGVVVVLSLVVGNSISQLTENVDEYQAKINRVVFDATERLEDLAWFKDVFPDFELSQDRLLSFVNAGALVRLITDATGGILSTLSNVFVILLLVIFMLFEAHGLPGKLRRASGDPDADLVEYKRVATQVYGYISMKTWISLFTGVLVAILLSITGVPFAILWGLVAFLFNFIPNIGSIIAAFPAVMLAVVLNGFDNAAVVALGYVAINMIIGNVLEPRLMGRRLGLSPLVVLLSLIFWSWVWGPVGMLVSLPMTMVVKILMENSEDFRSVAVLLGPVDDDE